VENRKVLIFKISMQYLRTCGAWEQQSDSC